MLDWIKSFPELYYRAKAVYNALILLVTGIGMVVADKAVSLDEAKYIVFLAGAVIAAWTVERTRNGPKPPELPVLDYDEAFRGRSVD